MSLAGWISIRPSAIRLTMIWPTIEASPGAKWRATLPESFDNGLGQSISFAHPTPRGEGPRRHGRSPPAPAARLPSGRGHRSGSGG